MCSYEPFTIGDRRKMEDSYFVVCRLLPGSAVRGADAQLRELEQDGFLHREIYKEIPPRVEYTLTELGESFLPILEMMMTWSGRYLCPDYTNPYK